jgi:hypothetical protein
VADHHVDGNVISLQAQREKREKEQFDAFRKQNPLITEQFEDLKRDLSRVSVEEWKAIPEIGDYTVKRRKRFETFSAVSDSLLAGALLLGNLIHHHAAILRPSRKDIHARVFTRLQCMDALTTCKIRHAPGPQSASTLAASTGAISYVP